MVRAPTFLVALCLVYVTTFLVADGLRFAPVKDETHFLESARLFAGDFDYGNLRDYPELVTPLALVVWGQLERLTGDGLWTGRLLNLLLSFGLACLVAFGCPGDWRRRALSTLGLLAFPYTLPLSTHLYTDVPAAALIGVGTVAVVRQWPVIAFLVFTASIATRQYSLQVPAALVASEGIAVLRGSVGRGWTMLACLGSVATLVGWYLFFGGLAPQAGIEYWIPLYPAPMLEPSQFIVHHGLYALAGIGAYFVLVEGLLFREIPARSELWRARSIVVAVALAALFLWDPPFLTSSHAGGPMGRVSRWLLPSPAFDVLRVALYYVLALIAALRFTARFDAGFWIVLAGVVLSMKQQLPWEKYLLPTLTVLWLLRASGALSPYGSGDRSASASNGFTKHPSPISRLST